MLSYSEYPTHAHKINELNTHSCFSVLNIFLHFFRAQYLHKNKHQAAQIHYRACHLHSFFRCDFLIICRLSFFFNIGNIIIISFYISKLRDFFRPSTLSLLFSSLLLFLFSSIFYQKIK